MFYQASCPLWLEPDEYYELKAGDTLYFHSHLKHSWKNDSQNKTTVLWVNAFLPEHAEVKSESEETGRSQKTSNNH